MLGRVIMRPSAQAETQADFLNQRGQALVGRVFTLETPIKDGEGRIRVDDSSWRVIGADRFAGAKVRVVRVEGTTLVVDDV
jgi:membrane protein implicated in regulation of membrane protease activity